MKTTFFTLLAVLTLGLSIPRSAPAQEADPILESYTVAHGGDGGAAGLKAVLSDENLGNGTARANIVFSPTAAGNQLSLRVTRQVRPGQIVFALLVFRVEIRAYNIDRELIYSRDLEGFTFGDSASGRWSQRLRDLPAGIAQLTVTFVGNYE